MKAKVLKKISSVQFEAKECFKFFNECINSHFRIILIQSRNSRKLLIKNKVTKKFNDNLKKFSTLVSWV